MGNIALSVIVSNATALFLLWLFFTAGMHKVKPANHDYYARVFTGYGLPAEWASGPLPALVGSLEIGSGILLVIPPTRVVGVILICTLLLVYLIAMGQHWVSGRQDIDCGCGGSSDSKTSISHHLLVRNVVLLALALSCLLPMSDIQIYRMLPASALWLIAIAAALMVVLYLSTEQLISNEQKLERLKGR